MRLFFLIIKLIFRVKIIFKEPKNYKLVIFDEESIIDIKNVIKNFDYFVIQNRIDHINKIYISAKIIKLIKKNYKGNIMTSYFVSLLEIGPLGLALGLLISNVFIFISVNIYFIHKMNG